jgi:hypothetical protein
LAQSNILIDSCASRGDTARTPAVAACDLAYDAKYDVHARWNRENGFYAAGSAFRACRGVFIDWGSIYA